MEPGTHCATVCARYLPSRRHTVVDAILLLALIIWLCSAVTPTAGLPQLAVNGTSSPRYRVEIVQPDLLMARDDPQFLTFRITNEDESGRTSPVTWTDLAVHAESRLHVVLVREGLRCLGHVHPEDFGAFGSSLAEDGRYRVMFEFTRPGKYGVLLTFVPQASGNHSDTSMGAGSGTDIVEGRGAHRAHSGSHAIKTVHSLHNVFVWPRPDVPLVGPDTVPAASPMYRFLPLPLPESGRYIEPIEDSALAVPQTDSYPLQNYLAELRRVAPASGPVSAGACQTFQLDLISSQQTVTDLEPFLENAAHITVAREDLGVIMHVHALPYPSAVLDGGETVPFALPTCGDGEGHITALTQNVSFGPAMVFALTFPEPGKYRLFSQSRRRDQMLVPAFTVDVDGPSGGAPSSSAVVYFERAGHHVRLYAAVAIAGFLGYIALPIFA